MKYIQAGIELLIGLFVTAVGTVLLLFASAPVLCLLLLVFILFL